MAVDIPHQASLGPFSLLTGNGTEIGRGDKINSQNIQFGCLEMGT